MRAWILALHIATAAATLPLTLAAQAPAGPAQPPVLPSVTLPPELDRVLRDYERAWRANDLPALALLFAEDGFVLQGGRPAVRGREAIQRAYAGGAGGPLQLRALAHGTDGAVGFIIGAYSYGASGSDVGKFTLTLRRGADGRWLIFSDMDNLSSTPQRRVMPAPPPA